MEPIVGLFHPQMSGQCPSNRVLWMDALGLVIGNHWGQATAPVLAYFDFDRKTSVLELRYAISLPHLGCSLWAE